MEGEEREEGKRRAWRWENALRKHNFVGFVGGVMEGVVAEQVRKGGYEGWIEEAKGRTRKRVKEGKEEGEDE